MRETEFKFIDTKMLNTRKILKDLTNDEEIQVELVYQLKRIADLMDNRTMKRVEE